MSNQKRVWKLGDKFTIGISNIQYTLAADINGTVKVEWVNSSGDVLFSGNHSETEVDRVFEKGLWKLLVRVNPFKEGDMVRFIKSKTATSFYEQVAHFSRGLEDQKVYKVKSLSTNGSYRKEKIFVTLEGDKGCYHHPYDCFELAKEPKKLYCISNTVPYRTSQLTVGKQYEISAEDSELYEVMDDSGRLGYYAKTRFSSKKSLGKFLIVIEEQSELTVGKMYEAISQTPLSHTYNVMGDEGRVVAVSSIGYINYNPSGERECQKKTTWKVGDRFKVDSTPDIIFSIVLVGGEFTIMWWSPSHNKVLTTRYDRSQIDRLFSDGTWQHYTGKGVVCIDAECESRLKEGDLYEVVEEDTKDLFVKVRSVKTGKLIDYWFMCGRFI